MEVGKAVKKIREETCQNHTASHFRALSPAKPLLLHPNGGILYALPRALLLGSLESGRDSRWCAPSSV